jgi:hypothetical protein
MPSTTPGARAPHVTLPDGTSILRAFSRGLTLVDHGGDRAGAIIAAAAELAVPVKHLPLDPAGPSADVCGHGLLLVRPDGHIAWSGERAPDDPAALLARVAGHSSVTVAELSR